MRARPAWLATGLTIGALLAVQGGCGAATPLAPAAMPGADQSPRGGHVASDRPREVTLDEVLGAVRADALRALQLPPNESLQVRSEDVVWRDGSLGCAQPGLMYTQALVPGWRIHVEAGDRTLIYHASRRGQWLWCPPGRAAAPLPGSGTH